MAKPYEPVEPQGLDEVNFLEQRLQNCPYHAYRMLRDEAPVWQDPVTGFYVVSRFEDLRGVLASWRWLHRWVALLVGILVVAHVITALRFSRALEGLFG